MENDHDQSGQSTKNIYFDSFHSWMIKRKHDINQMHWESLPKFYRFIQILGHEFEKEQNVKMNSVYDWKPLKIQHKILWLSCLLSLFVEFIGDNFTLITVIKSSTKSLIISVRAVKTFPKCEQGSIWPIKTYSTIHKTARLWTQ